MNEIHKFSLTDEKELVALHNLCMPDAWSTHIFQEILNDPQCIVIGLRAHPNDKSILGFLAARMIIEDEYEILTLAIHPLSRRKGYARSLLSHFIQTYINTAESCVHLEVRESNKPAILLYQAFGFQMVGMRKNYYDLHNGQKENALLLKLRLKNKKIILA